MLWWRILHRYVSTNETTLRTETFVNTEELFCTETRGQRGVNTVLHADALTHRGFSAQKNKLRLYPQQPQRLIFANLSKACCAAKRWKHFSWVSVSCMAANPVEPVLALHQGLPDLLRNPLRNPVESDLFCTKKRRFRKSTGRLRCRARSGTTGFWRRFRRRFRRRSARFLSKTRSGSTGWRRNLFRNPVELGFAPKPHTPCPKPFPESVQPGPARTRGHNKFAVESICMTRPICSVSFKCKTKKGHTSFFHGDNSWN